MNTTTVFTPEFWNERYAAENYPWDAGSATRPLAEYIDQLEDKDMAILIPGAGNAHEAAYLHARGFKNVHVLDWSELALQRFQEKYPEFPAEHLHCEDFFAHDGIYDLILEQTFFCALPPDRRPDWACHMEHILRPEGKVVGVLFSFPLTEEGPPWGGSAEEYRDYFEPFFEVRKLEPCYNSIKPRLGNELFFMLEK